METKNILVVGIWAFAIVWLVGALALDGDMLVTLMLFIAAVVVSLGAAAIPTERMRA